MTENTQVLAGAGRGRGGSSLPVICRCGEQRRDDGSSQDRLQLLAAGRHAAGGAGFLLCA